MATAAKLDEVQPSQPTRLDPAAILTPEELAEPQVRKTELPGQLSCTQG